MAKYFGDSITAACLVNVNLPDSCNYYTGKIYVGDYNKLLLAFDLSDVENRKIISAELSFLSRTTETIYLELYSGNSITMSYNELRSNCTQYSWAEGTNRISFEASADSWNDIPLSNYASAVSAAIKSGDYLIVAIIPESYIRVEISDSYNAYFGADCESLDPVVQNLTPNEKEVYLNKKTILAWDFEGDSVGQKSYEVGWSSDGGTTWNVISENSNSEHVDIPAYTFPEGTIRWRVRAISNEGKESGYVYASFDSVKQIPLVSVIAPDGIEIPNDKSCRFEWKYTGEDLSQKSYEIGWSSDEGSTWNDFVETSSNEYHVFLAGEFPNGNIKWRVRASNTADYFSEYSQGEFVCIAKLPNVQIEFPNDLNIPNSIEQIFAWTYNGNELEQKIYEIGWSSDGGDTWHSTEMTSSDTFHVFSAETFPVGGILWRIRVTNSAGYTSEYAYGEFDAVGQSEAPVIESISQNAIPTIGWSTSNQEAFEIQITGEGVSYESGMIAGAEIRSYQPNIMLADGLYRVKVRILNSYGIISEWGETAVFLHTEKPDSSPILTLKENNLFGVTLIGSGISGRGFYVRKETKKRKKLFTTSYVTEGTAWDTTNIFVGDYIPRIELEDASDHFTHKQAVGKGDVFRLHGGYALAPTEYSDKLVITDSAYIVIKTILFEDLADIGEYIFDEDGYFYLCAKTPKKSGFPLFYLESLGTDLPESFEDKETIIAEYVEGTPVVDCDLQPGRKYNYVLRDYSGGYIETSKREFLCHFSGIVFHDIENLERMLHIWLSESEYVRVESALGKSTVYKQCIGREFPIKESNFQKTEKIIVTGYLNVEQYQEAYELYCSDKIVLLRNENHCCYVDITDFKKQKYFDVGYIVEITFTRLDGKEEVKLV